MEGIGLVGKTVLIKRDEIKKQTESGLFLGDNQKKPDTGVIENIGLEFENYFDVAANMLGRRVRFRESFAEPIDIKGQEYLFFRDLDSSIYYYIED